MKKIHLLPNMITAFGLTCGLFVIFKMNMVNAGDVTSDILLATTGILVLAALADLLDGAIARAMRAESAFGTLFDSLADAITFGVAPAVVVLKTLSITPGTESSFFMTGAAIVYTVCGVLRLIRFNITNSLSETDSTADLITANKKNFTGLPIPAAAGAIISLNMFLFTCSFEIICSLDTSSRIIILFLALIFIGYLMVSHWRFPSLKALRVRVASFRMIFMTVLIAVFTFYGILNHFSLVIFIGCWTYVIVSFFLSLIRLIIGKKLKTLEDFEPDTDKFED